MKNISLKTILGATVIGLSFLSMQHAQAKDYAVDYEQSKVEFSGTHADKPFNGTFDAWTAEISFDANDLAASKLSAAFWPATVKTGNVMYNGTLQQADWFDVKGYQQVTFTSTSITAKEDGQYTANGDLTIRDITKPVTFDFTLSDLEASPVKATGELAIDRLDFDLGKQSDASAEWVGKEIKIKLDITATAQP